MEIFDDGAVHSLLSPVLENIIRKFIVDGKGKLIPGSGGLR